MKKAFLALLFLSLFSCKKEDVIPQIVESKIMAGQLEVTVQVVNSSQTETSDIKFFYKNISNSDFENLVDSKKIEINLTDAGDNSQTVENSIVSRVLKNSQVQDEIFYNKRVKRINSIIIK